MIVGICLCVGWSLSARRAWIEIAPVAANNDYEPVALRKESVDRNCALSGKPCAGNVALRKESVDRNTKILFKSKKG